VTPANADQIAAWDGEEGAQWARFHKNFERSNRDYRRALIDAAAIQPGERVLDIGCGNGASSRDAARKTGSGTVLGVDLSSAMLARARELASADGLVHVEFRQADAQVYAFAPGAFDVVISLFGSMFFDDKAAAFRNVAGALRPGGRMVLATWQSLAENEWTSSLFDALSMGRELPLPPPGGVGPFGLAEPDYVRSVLSTAGFIDIEIDDVRQQMIFGDDASSAYGFISQLGVTRSLLAGLEPDQQAEATDRLKRSIKEHESAHGVAFDSAAWLTRARQPA
jgi:SAM-dependent methyltransferase